MTHSRMYDAMFAILVLVVGWLWQRDTTLEAQMHEQAARIRAELMVRAADRWTGSQQAEYKNRIDERYAATDERIKTLERFHIDQQKCLNIK